MRKSKSSFRHESLQDRDSILAILKALSEGITSGRIVLSDEDEEIVMKPRGLLHLKLSASQDENQNRISLRVSWQEKSKPASKKASVSVKAG